MSVSRIALCIAVIVASNLGSPLAIAQSSLTQQPDPQGGGSSRPQPDVDNLASISTLPDLALLPDPTIGSTVVPWGTSAVIADTQAASKSNGKCSFRYLYATRNLGLLASAPTTNRIFLNVFNGPLLASAPLPALAFSAAANSSGHVTLSPGTWLLYVHADSPGVNAEFDENNNLRRIQVTVQGSCQ